MTNLGFEEAVEMAKAGGVVVVALPSFRALEQRFEGLMRSGEAASWNHARQELRFESKGRLIGVAVVDGRPVSYLAGMRLDGACCEGLTVDAEMSILSRVRPEPSRAVEGS